MTIILLPTALEPSAPALLSARPLTVVWLLVALMALQFAIAHTLELDLRLHWGLVGDPFFRVVSFTTSSWSLYADVALFAPWQLWSYILVNDGWVLPILDLVLLAVAGRAVERGIGSLSFLGAVLTLAPLAGVIQLLLSGRDEGLAAGVSLASPGLPVTGADGLVAGVLGMAWALYPQARMRWGVAYFAVVALGYLPLFRLALPWIALAFLLACGAAHWQDAPAIRLAGDLGALCAGAVLGLAGRRIQGPAAQPGGG